MESSALGAGVFQLHVCKQALSLEKFKPNYQEQFSF